MRIRKGGVSRDIDDSRLADYLEKGYSVEPDPPEVSAEGKNPGKPRKSQK